MMMVAVREENKAACRVEEGLARKACRGVSPSFQYNITNISCGLVLISLSFFHCFLVLHGSHSSAYGSLLTYLPSTLHFTNC